MASNSPEIKPAIASAKAAVKKRLGTAAMINFAYAIDAASPARPNASLPA